REGHRRRRVIVREVESVDRIRVGGRGRHLRSQEDRGVGSRRAEGGTVAVHGVAGDAAGGRRPREGDPCGGDAGGLKAGGGGGWLLRRGGSGMEDGAHRVPVGGGGKGGHAVLGPRGARRDVLFVGEPIRCLRPRRVGYTTIACYRPWDGRAAGHTG